GSMRTATERHSPKRCVNSQRYSMNARTQHCHLPKFQTETLPDLQLTWLTYLPARLSWVVLLSYNCQAMHKSCGCSFVMLGVDGRGLNQGDAGPKWFGSKVFVSPTP